MMRGHIHLLIFELCCCLTSLKHNFKIVFINLAHSSSISTEPPIVSSTMYLHGHSVPFQVIKPGSPGSPFSPLDPGTPGSPSLPGGPACPGIPRLPRRPSDPLTPLTPGRPGDIKQMNRHLWKEASWTVKFSNFINNILLTLMHYKRSVVVVVKRVST